MKAFTAGALVTAAAATDLKLTWSDCGDTSTKVKIASFKPDHLTLGQIDTPWDYIQSSGVVTGGQYQGSGPFGKGLCSSFSLPHCHHHGPQGDDPYPAEGAPGCPSQSSPSCPRECDAAAASPHNDHSADKI